MADKEIDGIEITDDKGKVVRIVKVKGRAAELLNMLDDITANNAKIDFGVKGDNGFGEPPFPPINTNTRLQRSAGKPTDDQGLWAAIRDRTKAIGFDRYNEFIQLIFCPPFKTVDEDQSFRNEGISACQHDGTKQRPLEAAYHAQNVGAPTIEDRINDLSGRPGIYGIDAYQLLKLATQAFLLFEAGVVIKGTRKKDTGIPETLPDQITDEQARANRPFDDIKDANGDILVEGIKTSLTNYLKTGNGHLPYLDQISQALASLHQSKEEGLPFCNNIIQHRLHCPSMLELIWSYWQEEGMLVQTMNAIALRFQNKKRHAQDPLANLALDPLRPLSNIVWGFIQDEMSRLSVQRRAYEYDSQYGITLVGKAIPNLQSADSRSQFIGAFHNLLYRTAMFYREDDDATIVADAFALLNTIREVHLILAEGAHNQFGDLPWTARHEMLMMQWMLARPEIKEFLRGRYSVPYQEPWMSAVDDMKRLQGWTDTSSIHFRELAGTGEQILLSLRYGNWINVNDQEQARNWARSWRPEIQRYMHAYQAVSGVDLTAENVNASIEQSRNTQPSQLIRQRQAKQAPQLANQPNNHLRLGKASRKSNAELTSEVPSRLRLGYDD